MSMKYLGETIDIHAGGIDHVPVHHTNEIAQSEAATGKPFAKHWMHSNHITIEGEKVSKSLGNGITLEDIEAKGINLEAFRLHVLESHYRSQSKFSWESLQAAQNRLKRFRNFAAMRHQLNSDYSGSVDPGLITFQDKLHELLNNDLDTPQALAALEAFMDSIEKNEVSASRGLFESFLQTIDASLGLKLLETTDIEEDQKQLVSEREQARQDKDWAKSDELRNKLAEQGIGLRDTEHGAIWYRL